MSNKSKLHFVLVSFGVFLTIAGVVFWIWQIKKKREMLAYRHRFVESKFRLNETDQKNLPLAKDGYVFLDRLIDEQGIHQMRVDQSEKEGAKGRLMGKLYKVPSPKGEVDKPVFLCEFKEKAWSNSSISLSANDKCFGVGKLMQSKPVGYTSKMIRQGFLILSRCLNKDKGYYLSLNTFCESPQDHLQELLGSVKTVE